MNARRVEITLSQERWEQLEAARGHEPRAAFIKRTLGLALDGWEPPASNRATVAARTTVPTVKSVRELAMERQAKLNEAKS